MTNLASYFIVGLALVLVSDYFNPIVDGGTALSGMIRGTPTITISNQAVDRSHKSDRLEAPARITVMVRDIQPLQARRVRLQVFDRPKPASLPVGCDALASALARSSLSDLAGRCLTDNSTEREIFATGRMRGEKHSPA
jgi:hypothetical protein